MSNVNKVFDRIRSRANTVNQYNEGLIALENIITPDEAREIAAGMEQRVNPEVNVWHSREADWRWQFAEWSTVTGFSHAHGFERVWNRPSATLYRTTGFSGKAPTRLVVLFTGGVNRMMVPAWIFLAHFPRQPFYVLAVRSGWTFYREGLPGLAKDFPTTVTWIRELAKDMGLAVDIVMGSSGASIPALRAGHALGARRRILFGLPRLSDEVLSDYPLAVSGGPGSGVLHDDGRGLFLITGSEESRDLDAVAEARRTMPRVSAVIVSGAQHNVVEVLVRNGRLHRLLRTISGGWFRLGS